MRQRAWVGFLIVVITGCGPGPATHEETASDTTGSSGAATETTQADATEAESGEAEAETETESGETETESGETEEACVPGEIDCECLPDGSCSNRPYFLGCTSGGTCQGCGFGFSIVSPPCRADACPTDCVIELSEYGIGPLEPFTIPFLTISNAQMQLLYVGDACASESGWTWIVEAEQIELCGDYCDAWMQPALEGTGYDIELGCPPG
jgi:hypothetical protein